LQVLYLAAGVMQHMTAIFALPLRLGLRSSVSLLSRKLTNSCDCIPLNDDDDEDEEEDGEEVGH
jgi:hypothetical protein